MNNNNNNNKVCKFYVKGNCRDGDSCKFNHINNICRNYFLGTCTKEGCTFSHEYKLEPSKDQPKNENNKDKDKNNNNNNKKHRPKKFVNTENYEPSFRPHDMIVKLIMKPEDSNSLTERDLFLCPGLFQDQTIYKKLLDEIKNTGKNDIFKLWHGDTHYIVDDHINWKKLCPTFSDVINKIKTYFGVEVKATRFNYYENSSHFKPYHFDAAAFDEEKAKFQNITIGVSFGATRDIAFEHAVSKNTISFPLIDGMIYGFCKKINIDWRHGIPQIHPDNFSNDGRISIIIWGYKNLL